MASAANLNNEETNLLTIPKDLGEISENLVLNPISSMDGSLNGDPMN